MDDNILSFQFDTVVVTPRSFEVRSGREALNLEPKAIRVLIHLIRNRDRVVTKDELVQTVWEGAAVTDNAITRVIAQLRRELGDDPRTPKFVETVPTMGYRFIADVEEVRVGSGAPVAGPPPVAGSTPGETRPGRSRWQAGAAVLGLVAMGGWWGATHRQPEVRPGGTKAAPIQVTTTSGMDAKPSFSPDGRSFAYCSNKTGQFELYRRELAVGTTVQITGDGQQNIQPAWSPDGKWIAYHSAARHGIWVVAASGGTPKRLTQFGASPAWSPDSRTIAFNSQEPFSLAPFDTGAAGTIWMIDLNGSALRQLTQPGNPRGSHASPAFRRDGQGLAFVSLGRDSAIHLLELATGKSTAAVRAGQDIPRLPGNFVSRLWDPVFGPRDEFLYFSAAGEKGEHAIWMASVGSNGVGGEKPRRVFASQSDIPTGLSVAPDGSRLLFTGSRNASQLWVLEEGSEKAAKPLFQEAVLRAYIPSYSPDGKWVAFAVETQGRNRDLWVMPAAGGEAMPISADPGAKEAGTVWTPDGELLYNYGDSADVEFRGFHPETRKTRTLVKRSVAGIFHPTLMPNARDILCSCSTPMNICLGPATAQTPRQLTFDRERAWFAKSDRTGEWIAYEVTRGDSTRIGVMRADGSEARVLTDESAQNWPHSFSSDSRRIAYSSFREGVWNLWWIDRVTGERKQLTSDTAFGSFVRSPAWRPGTRQIAYERFEARGNIFVLDLDLR